MPPYARNQDFAKLAAAFVEAAAERGLKPGDRVLDVGCGVGRFAVGFAGFTSGNGRYDGLDASRESIDTCNTYIASRLPQFRFTIADVFNSHYRPDADQPAAGYRFPFEDRSFDFVFSNSLFTHLTADDFRRYLQEIGRVLDTRGRTFNTFFLLNDEVRAGLDRGAARLEFPHAAEGGVARVKDPERPEAAIAYDEDFVREAHAAARLRIEEPIRYGSWSGREASGPGFGNKDIVVALRA